MFVLAAAVVAGCKKPSHESGNIGGFSVSVDEISDKYVTKAGDILDADEFIYSIVSKTTDEVFMSGKVGEMPSVFEDVPADKYIITVSSPDTKPAAFDQPIISGFKEFEVKPSEITSVQVLCTIQNVKVSIIPDEKFFSELESYTITISNGEGPEHTLIWTNGALGGANCALLTQENVGVAKSGYFTVASALDIYITGYRRETSVYAIYEGAIAPVAAKDHFIVKLFAKETGQVGGDGTPGITITVDYTTVEKNEDITVDGFIETPVEGPDGPSAGGGEDEEDKEIVGLSLQWDANPEYGLYELKSDYGDGEVNMSLTADNVVSGFIVKISSPTVDFMNVVKMLPGVTSEGDYAVLDFSKAETAEALSFLTVDNQPIIGATEVEFSLGTLLPMIIESEPAVNTVHTFVMEVTDGAGQFLRKELQFEYRGR